MYYWRIPFGVFVGFLNALCAVGEQCYLNMTVYRHANCSEQLGPIHPLITLPTSSDTYIQADQGCGCFKISGGRVRIGEPGFGGSPTQVHLDMRIGGSRVPHQCQNASANGCGGFGSCVYCDICNTVENENKNNRFGDDIVSIRKNGRKIHCGYKLQPGYHRDITLSICLPPKQKLLQTLAENPRDAQDIWKTFFKRNQGGSQAGVPFVIFARTFNEAINHLSEEALRELIRDPNKRNGMVGCHWMYGIITDNSFSDEDSSPARGPAPNPFPHRVSNTRGGTPRFPTGPQRFNGASSPRGFNQGQSRVAQPPFRRTNTNNGFNRINQG